MPKIEEQRKALQALLTELEAGQQKMADGGLSQNEGEALEAKAKEAEALQADLERFEKLGRITSRSRELANQPLPSGKREDAEDDSDATAGFLSVGEAFVASPEYKAAIASGLSKGVTYPAAKLAGFDHRSAHVRLTKGQHAALMERKAVPTIGAGVIPAQRLAEIVRVSELDDLGFLAVQNTAPMTSPTVEYARVTSFTSAAAPTAEGVGKPEAALVTDQVTETARTIAVWIPVTEQQLMDAPMVINEVNTHLMWDVRRELEDQCLYGPGGGQNFTGYLNDSDVVAGRSVSGDTLIDKVKRAATDIAVTNYRANAAVFHPYDWEAIVLSKGSDNRYVWVVVTEPNGASRIWGLRASEANGMEERGVIASEPERNVLVGDFARGSTLYVREDVSIQVGYNDDDFIKNKRTIRAEMRGILAIKRPGAFRKILTHTASGAS